MSRRANFVKIGIFVLSATTVLVGGLILFGLRETFKPGVMVETAFDQTVQGLTVGSDVKFRGVKIGTVKNISLLSAAYPTAPAEYRSWVLVRAKVDKEFFRINNIADIESSIGEEIRKGMRAFLSPQGITGLVFLELDYEMAKKDVIAEPENAQLLLAPKWESDTSYLYIPGAPGFIKSFLDSTQSIAESADKFMREEFPRLSSESIAAIEKATATMETVRLYIASPELAAIPARIDKLLNNLDELTNEDEQAALTNLLRDAQDITSSTLTLIQDPAMRGNLAELRKLLTETREVAVAIRQEVPETTEALRSVLERVDLLIASQQHGLNSLTAEMRQVLRNVEQLTSILKDNPSLILFSTDPRPVEPAR